VKGSAGNYIAEGALIGAVIKWHDLVEVVPRARRENAMRLDDLPESSNVEDRRSEGGFGGGGGFGMPIGGGGLGIGTIVVLGLLGWALGIDPSLLIGGAEILTGPSQPQVQAPPSARRNTAAPQDDMGRFVSKVLGSTEFQWKQVFAKDGKTYRAPVLVLYRDRTQASCGGVAQSAMGPFYCPSDQKVYLDTSFFDQIATRFRGCDVGSKTCQFSQAYVIAHEVGHHVQNLLGILPKAQQAQRAADSKAAANHIQVQVELQADCLAGVWANRENESLKAQGKPAFIEPGDVEAALRTAAAIGDDTLQRRAQGYVVPDSFTHGSAEQRQRWFNTGFRSGSIGSCNTFASAQL
jgi:predicted metalloprotease